MTKNVFFILPIVGPELAITGIEMPEISTAEEVLKNFQVKETPDKMLQISWKKKVLHHSYEECFYVERSLDKINYQVIGNLDQNHLVTGFIDHNPTIGKTFYRITAQKEGDEKQVSKPKFVNIKSSLVFDHELCTVLNKRNQRRPKTRVRTYCTKIFGKNKSKMEKDLTLTH